MSEPSFDQLAAEAAAGLKGDQELYRDVTEELRGHLEDKSAYFTRQGHDAAESVALSKKAFGSPLDVAAELLEANRSRLKLRAALRLAFGLLIVPLAILLALYVGYGRMARLQRIFAWTSSITEGWQSFKLPTLPFMDAPIKEPYVSEQGVLQQPDDFPREAPALRRYWESHRNREDSKEYFAYYALFAWPPNEADMRLGEQLEPQNALYRLWLAEDALTRGISVQDNKHKEHGKRCTDVVLDRKALAAGIAELQAAVTKPHLRTYQMQILRKRLNAMPRPMFTEDYFQRIAVDASELFPHMARYRDLSRKIPASARVLLAEGHRAEAEAVMDTWKPLMRLLLQDNANCLIQVLTVQACGLTLAEEGEEVYAQLGAHAKAREAHGVLVRLMQLREKRHGHSDNEYEAFRKLLDQHGSILSRIMFPVFGGIDHTNPSAEEVMPSRMHEHVLFEETTVGMLLLGLMLALVGALLQGAWWLYRLRRAAAIPLLLMPPAREIMRALLYGIALPMLVYWLYSRAPIIGGREYGWSYLWWRFSAEQLFVLGIAFWLPAHLMRLFIRRRCTELDIDMPAAKVEAGINRKVGAGILSAVILLAIVSSISSDISTPFFKTSGICMAVALLIIAACYARKQRNAYGLYFGTLARSLAPVYALYYVPFRRRATLAAL
ncbi:MAG TPA: hypothetical protein VGL77_15320 [Armatimonadota bacterium]|jgi:hypothetical protein